MGTRFTFTFGAISLARYPLLAWGLLAAVLGCVMLFIPSIHFENNIQRGFSSDSDNSRSFAELVASLEVRDRQLVLMAQSDARFTTGELLALRDFTLDLSLVAPVAEVASPFALRFPPQDDEAVGRPALDLQAAPWASLNAFSLAHPSVPTLVSEDGQAMLFFAAPQSGLDETQLRALIAEVSAMATSAETDNLQLSLTGEDAIAFAVVDALIADLTRLNLIGAAAAFLLCMIVLRSIRWTFIAFIPGICAMLVAFAAFPLLGVAVTVTNVVVPILAFMLALSDAIHLTWHLRERLANEPRKTAILASIRAIAPANALTSMTTGIGFLAISTSTFSHLDELAWVGGFSVIAAYWVVIAGVVVLAPLGKARRSASASRLQIPKALASWPGRRPVLVLALAALAIVVSTLSAVRVEPWIPLYQNLPATNEIRQAHRAIEDRFAGYFRIWLEVDNLDEATRLESLSALTEAIHAVSPRTNILSVAAFSQWAGNNGAFDESALQNLPSALQAELAINTPGLDRVVVFVPEPMHDRETLARHDRIVEAALAAGADRVVGFPIILRDDALQVVEELGRGLALACLLATGLVALAFGSFRLFPILLIPNAIPLLVATAFLPLINAGQINPSALLALTVAFGIAVDDSIHLLNRYALERQNGADVTTAIADAIRGTGRVMMTTTLVISAGMASTFISDFQTIRLFGALLIVIFTSALVADLIVLPSLIKLGYRR